MSHHDGEDGGMPAHDADSVHDDLVILLDDDGNQVGTAPRATVHSQHTPRHLAFSCHVLDVGGRVLLTRRALTKVAWPGVWTNTCCGHPRIGETIIGAAVRRTHQELGLDLDPRRMRVVLPGFSYRATDAGGIVEDELCPVVVARLSLPEELVELNPDPEEVEEVTWVGWQDMYGLARSMPALLSPWAVEQMLEFGPELPVVR
ncbi:isopentenyl-diphosphate Delta-isomerase [Cutibacterium avidum]|uniref:isopentenyl-diphosphate Delta-isomerase n=1 Tax=Cutibacterium avidum TaxID=33010 RepID=UPI00059F25DC|nr:isopentenyl-diphosphate Delta-isomerase [Cutibacterium avidum]MCO6671473.1 isopentenyl-diphosphate Delta-isomerase [Cutibacterium avidum]MDU5024168.1 isopentenyl-diphosphate Delta-isomerase [Cutibacterium avidum]PGX67651.1 isopentenyl-diphosphate Delta-isomerase [Cutibacterium avidum]PGX68486.1 isopentenyl-diphosphate Delta-isomerase [Cutibacterium avidum]